MFIDIICSTETGRCRLMVALLCCAVLTCCISVVIVSLVHFFVSTDAEIFLYLNTLHLLGQMPSWPSPYDIWIYKYMCNQSSKPVHGEVYSI